MNLPAPITLAAAVLAGGRSSRMGRDKALLRWQGERLIDRQLALLESIRPQRRLLSAASGVDYGRPEIETVPDRIAHRGPLGALEALFARIEATHLLVVAVDMPFLTAGVLAELSARCTPTTGVVPLCDGRPEPLAAIYPRACARRLPELLASGRGAMRDLIEPAAAAGELHLWPVPAAAWPAFANWNRPDDLPDGSAFA